jgi:hypothetical protein
MFSVNCREREAAMQSRSIIHPGANHVSVFRFAGPQPQYRTLRRNEHPHQDPDHKVDDKNENTGTEGDEKPPLTEGRGDEDWWRRVPGIVAPDRSVMIRAFEDLQAIRGAVPEITAVARAAGGLQPQSPDFVLVARHVGPLDASHVFALGEDLGRAGISATIVIDHDDRKEP